MDFDIEYIVIHINIIHRIDGVNFVNPSEIFAKLFDAIPKIIAIVRKKYPSIGFILIVTK
tara:strand:+ start:801 stop:980 length:180 start_codon:yes stop_codon:yes gene_type:complete